jgi:hypothetical protein
VAWDKVCKEKKGRGPRPKEHEQGQHCLNGTYGTENPL